MNQQRRLNSVSSRAPNDLCSKMELDKGLRAKRFNVAAALYFRQITGDLLFGNGLIVSPDTLSNRNDLPEFSKTSWNLASALYCATTALLTESLPLLVAALLLLARWWWRWW
ncbi:hypothetical protein ACP275_07G005200 [Erythranthe tilingii]